MLKSINTFQSYYHKCTATFFMNHSVYYGLDACPLNRDQVRSLDFAVSSCFRKIFCVWTQTVTEECKTLFNCLSVPETMITRKYKYLHKYIYLDNELRKLFNDRAITDLST